MHSEFSQLNSSLERKIRDMTADFEDVEKDKEK